jgi:hypothetical protein
MRSCIRPLPNRSGFLTEREYREVELARVLCCPIDLRKLRYQYLAEIDDHALMPQMRHYPWVASLPADN